MNNKEFPVIWADKEKSSTKYEIVRVPKNVPIDIVYTKPSIGISLTISSDPDTELYWRVKGQIDADTIYNLGLPTSEKREAKIPPLVTSGNIEKINQNFGTISQYADNSTLWNASLKIPVNGVYHFLDAVWQPRDRKIRYAWQLTQVGVDYRDIPTKRGKAVLSVRPS